MKSSAPKDLNVLVIGATGAGKSSLINLFYCWSYNWDVKGIISSQKVLIQTKYFQGDSEAEEDVSNQGQSQTKIAKQYLIFPLFFENTRYRVNFIDTPGIGDTIEQDNKNLKLILDIVLKTKNLNAIILVLNGAESRLHSRIQRVVKKLQSVLSNDLTQNLIILLTNVDLEPLLDVKQLLGFPIDDGNIFFYNNQLFNLPPQYFNNKNILYRAQQTYEDSIHTIEDMLKKIISFPMASKKLSATHINKESDQTVKAKNSKEGAKIIHPVKIQESEQEIVAPIRNIGPPISNMSNSYKNNFQEQYSDIKQKEETRSSNKNLKKPFSTQSMKQEKRIDCALKDPANQNTNYVDKFWKGHDIAEDLEPSMKAKSYQPVIMNKTAKPWNPSTRIERKKY